MARSSSPAMGCSTSKPCLSRRTHRRELLKIDFIAADADRLAHAQAVSEHHEGQQMVPNAVPALLERVEERGDLGGAQEVFGALVGVGCLNTFDISPVGRGRLTHRDPS